MANKYTLSLDDQEMMDVLCGLERLKEHARDEAAERRFQKLWEKITDAYEERV